MDPGFGWRQPRDETARFSTWKSSHGKFHTLPSRCEGRRGRFDLFGGVKGEAARPPGSAPVVRVVSGAAHIQGPRWVGTGADELSLISWFVSVDVSYVSSLLNPI